VLDWFREGHRALVETLGGADESVSCWTFLPGARSPLAFWTRRQAHETAIHLVDAESALGRVPGWSPAFAADGVDELLNGFFARPGGRLVADRPRSLAVVATDAGVAWTMTIGPDGRRTVPGRQPADLTVEGPAADLYLLLWNRLPAGGTGGGTGRLDLRGDGGVLDLWRERATVTWS
jgi:uncharacterized protein (TIGR03083 family)